MATLGPTVVDFNEYEVKKFEPFFLKMFDATDKNKYFADLQEVLTPKEFEKFHAYGNLRVMQTLQERKQAKIAAERAEAIKEHKENQKGINSQNKAILDQKKIVDNSRKTIQANVVSEAPKIRMKK